MTNCDCVGTYCPPQTQAWLGCTRHAKILHCNPPQQDWWTGWNMATKRNGLALKARTPQSCYTTGLGAHLNYHKHCNPIPPYDPPYHYAPQLSGCTLLNPLFILSLVFQTTCQTTRFNILKPQIWREHPSVSLLVTWYRFQNYRNLWAHTTCRNGKLHNWHMSYDHYPPPHYQDLRLTELVCIGYLLTLQFGREARSYTSSGRVQPWRLFGKAFRTSFNSLLTWWSLMDPAFFLLNHTSLFCRRFSGPLPPSKHCIPLQWKDPTP